MTTVGGLYTAGARANSRQAVAEHGVDPGAADPATRQGTPFSGTTVTLGTVAARGAFGCARCRVETSELSARLRRGVTLTLAAPR